MKSLCRLAGIALLVASPLLGGCGGVAFGGASGIGLGLGSGSSFQLVPQNCLSLHSAFGAAGINPAVLAGERRNQVAQIQSRYNLASSDVRVEQALWKSIAAGGC